MPGPRRQAMKKPSLLAILLWLCWVWATPGRTEIIVPVIDQSRVEVTVSVDFEFDAATGLYTYRYRLTSGPGSELDVESFALKRWGKVLNPQAPAGWYAGDPAGRPFVNFYALEVEPLPPDYVDIGNIPPSSVSIKPGETLGGFSLRSPKGPKTLPFYAQGYAPLPQSEYEGDFEGIHIPSFTENSFVGATIGPGRDDFIVVAAGSGPSVEGFLGLVGVDDGATLSPPVALTLRVALHGETVDRSSFAARLNTVDVTGSFRDTGNGGEMIAIFELADSPLEAGRNVLATSVAGTVPGTTRIETDEDSFTFIIE